MSSGMDILVKCKRSEETDALSSYRTLYSRRRLMSLNPDECLWYKEPDNNRRWVICRDSTVTIVWRSHPRHEEDCRGCHQARHC
jgi:hypothetical protein